MMKKKQNEICENGYIILNYDRVELRFRFRINILIERSNINSKSECSLQPIIIIYYVAIFSHFLYFHIHSLAL